MHGLCVLVATVSVFGGREDTLCTDAAATRAGVIQLTANLARGWRPHQTSPRGGIFQDADQKLVSTIQFLAFTPI